MPPVQDLSLDLFTSHHERYHYAMDAYAHICITFNLTKYTAAAVEEWMICVLGHDSALLRLYWVGDNLGEWDKVCYEQCRQWKKYAVVTCWALERNGILGHDSALLRLYRAGDKEIGKIFVYWFFI